MKGRKNEIFLSFFLFRCGNRYFYLLPFVSTQYYLVCRMGIESDGSLIVIWYLGSLHRCGKWILFDGQKKADTNGASYPRTLFTREMQEMSNTNWEDQTHITRRAKAKNKTNKKKTNFNPVWTFGDKKAKKKNKRKRFV